MKAAFRPELATGGEDTVKIRVCAGSTCNATGRAAVSDALTKELAKRGLSDKVQVVLTGCHGLCQEGPIAVVHPKGVFYPRLKAKDMAEIVETSVVGDDVVERLLYRDPATGEAIALEKDVPFYAGQTRIVRAENGYIDPTSIDDYLSRGGYTALAKVLADDAPEAVIDEVEQSGLRGRGGAGFPTGTKWRYCRANPGQKHYLIANGDEGDPGAFMDRAILEDNPHSLVEGMLIGAFAIGADEGYIYVRHEYPLAVSRLRHALEQARERGLLGDDILGTGWSFDLKINQGAGAFVCGESTALTASIEGHRGMPRGKHIRTVAHGLWQQPTDLNNVETFANVPWIVNHGADAFAAHGHRRVQGHEDLLAHRQGAELRPRRGAHGRHPARGHLRRRRRHAGRPRVQGRAARRPERRLPAGRPARHADRLREPHEARLHDGLRRHGRRRRRHLHGRLRQVLLRVHRPGELRQVRALPRRHAARARDPRAHLRRHGHGARRRAARAAQRRHHRRARCASSAAAPPTRS